MNERLTNLARSIRVIFRRSLTPAASALGEGAGRTARGVVRARGVLIALGVAVGSAYLLVKHPPVQTVPRGDVGIRINQFSGGVAEFRDGTVIALPGLHELRTYTLRDQVYRPTAEGKDTQAPFQSVEGLSFNMDLSIRYALDPARVAAMSRNLPDDIGGEIVQPAVQGVIYKVLTRYTMREIFSSKRAEIQATLEADIKARLAADGILLRSVQMGKVELPADYRQGMDKLLAEELETEKMRYTLVLKEKRVQEVALDAEAERVRREKAATAQGNEQIIAAKAQEEAMKHVLPFKQKQIEQRQFEAEAEKQARIRTAEGNASARKIEAAGEAESRQKLADAEAYRMDRVGKIASEQMARDGALLSRHPLLIQKTVADKLSDKIQVIIAPPSTNGDFIAAGLVGGSKQMAPSTHNEATEAKEGE